ncbi:hypothetical protein EK21DRAFT_88523 [Setomelanomma holmii]|uniref:Uncharacterized protein n=1 Tax=Setomelanomma holmii TaxID=210430 RepID=A0A9P4HB68_9PLEO|nr:hypothetical protein EK21DRAFT_88523 [Setomelanomma holmii]
MASPTVPTVPFPTATDFDIDDDDDDAISSLVPGPVATTPPVQLPAPVPPSGITSAAGRPSANIPEDPIPKNLPFGSSTPLETANGPNNDSNSLGTGASAGIGVGVAIAVILAAIAAWMFVRIRRRRRQQQGKTSQSTYNGDSPDKEVAQRTAGPDIRAYYAGGASELPNGKETVTGEPSRQYNELASPIVPQEIHGDRDFAAKLPGSAVSATGTGKSSEGWSSPPPIYKPGAPRSEKKSGVRLFDDAPIDDLDSPVGVDERPRPVDQKGGL